MSSDAGVVGNARLTAATGLVLLVLFIGEIVTDLLGVAGVLTAHVLIGVMSAPPVLVKLGSTGWRIVRYYRGARPYVERGAPHTFLRVLGPILVTLTVVLLASGFLAYYTHGGVYTASVKTHKVTFYLWLLAMLGHVVPHFAQAVSGAAADLSDRTRVPVPGAARRQAVILAALVVGAGLGIVLSGHVGAYFHGNPVRVHL